MSPLKHAAKVGVPLLIAHGTDDTRVLLSQSKAMVDALAALDKPVEWMPFEGEVHGFRSPINRLRFYAALATFLERHIGDKDSDKPAGAAAGARSGTND